MMDKKILVVDDDKQIALLLASRLKANKYDIVVAHDAVQAIDKAFKERPDLILLDIKMPGGGGFRVMDYLRHSASTALIPIIVITAYGSAEIQQMAKDKRAIHMIRKPFKAEDLLPRVRAALGEVSR
jgi:CheY-like chemotaxis protein